MSREILIGWKLVFFIPSEGITQQGNDTCSHGNLKTQLDKGFSFSDLTLKLALL